MGQGWRRVTEAVRQKMMPAIVSDKNFKSSSNGRNEAMFKEATDFAAHLRTLERDLRSLQKQVDGHFTNMRNILLSPLPRAYEEGQNGPAPIEEEPRAIGQNVHIDKIAIAAEDMRKRLDSEVIQPIKEWMVAYRTIQDRMKQLEAVRLELDSRRRTVDSLQGRYERQKANLGTTRQKGQLELEQTEKTMQHKEEKMMRTATHYQEMERTVYNSLFTLVKDTSVLRDYAAAALQIVQECFATAHSSFDGNAHAGFSVNNYDDKYEPVHAGAPERVKSNKTFIHQLSEKAKMPSKPMSDFSNLPENDAHERPYDQVPYSFDAAAPSKMIEPEAPNPYRSAYIPNPGAARYQAMQPSSNWREY